MIHPTQPVLVANQGVSAELAMRDLGDIKELAKNEAFNRYFLRRLTQKHTEIEQKLKYEPAEKCPPTMREEYRQKLLLIEEIQGMLKTDESACRSTLITTGFSAAI